MPQTAVVRALDLTLCAVLAVLVAASLAVVEVFWLPLRVGGLLVPVSVVAAVGGNLLLVELAYRGSGSRLVAVLPALTWVVVAVGSSLRRPEGDLVLIGTGGLGVVGMAFLLLGVVAAAFAAGRVLMRPRLPGPPEPGPVAVPLNRRDPAPDPAGSGSGGAR
jgi:hypothetical protein